VKRTPLPASAGFTLIELMIVIVVVGVLAAIAFMRNTTPAAYTMLAQGELLAANLRHAQTLATTWSRSLSVGVSGGTNGTYSVSCVTTSSSLPSPCNVSPVLDPATGSSFSVSLQNSVSISGPSSLTLDSFGKPSAGATYTLSSSDAASTVTVTVLATTGVVTVSMQ
jgi:prepilin-type N-terminal cleavage/methylation domain-containing protein